MKVLGIYGSPRKGGNSDALLDQALAGAEAAGAEIERVYCRKLKMSGCLECGGCDETGECVVKDGMQQVYPLLDEAGVIILSAPIFFYNVPAQAKAVIDRCQARWAGRMLNKTAQERKSHDSGQGYFICVAATKGERIFEGSELVARYMYDALDMSYGGALLVRGLDAKGAAKDHPDKLKEAFAFGQQAVKGS